jgi:probable rRNA maturation factor
MLVALDLEGAELSVLLTDDPTIHGLNSRHRGKKQPTDVLAFPLLPPGEPPAAGAPIGDVVISLDTAQRHAARGGLELLDEVRGLLAHGVLHLLGYDHQTDAEERTMDDLAGKLAEASRRRAGDVPKVRPEPRQRRGKSLRKSKLARKK